MWFQQRTKQIPWKCFIFHCIKVSYRTQTSCICHKVILSRSTFLLVHNTDLFSRRMTVSWIVSVSIKLHFSWHCLTVLASPSCKGHIYIKWLLLRQLHSFSRNYKKIFCHSFTFFDNVCRPAIVAEWIMHSAAMCSRAWCTKWPGFDSARVCPPTKELFLIIPMQMMNWELIPGR